MHSTPVYFQAAPTVLHNAATALPVPTAAAGAVLFRNANSNVTFDPALTPVALLADVVFYPGATPFSITGPVEVWARVSVPGALDTWVKQELLELTALSLAAGPVSYRLNLSPWWDRVAVAAPSWVAGVGETVTVRVLTYGA